MHDDEAVPETAAVEVRLLGIDRVHGAKGLIALCAVLVTIAEIELMLQGVQVRRLPDGRLEVWPPQFKSASGRWYPAVVLPEIVLSAICDAFEEAADPRVAAADGVVR